MSVGDLLPIFQKYGLVGTIAAIAVAALFATARLFHKNLQEQLEETKLRNKMLELELRHVNADMQKYLLLGIATHSALAEATDTLRRDSPDDHATGTHT